MDEVGEGEGGVTEKIWIVMGSTGEYSDHREWHICAYRDEAEAKALAEKLSALMRSAQTDAETIFDNKYQWRETAHGKQVLVLDAEAETDYTGTNYTAFELELK